MKLALECPTELLGDIQPLADFYWTLTHLVLSDRDYANYYIKHKGEKLSTLDNSVNELLEPCSLSEIKEAVGILGGVHRIVSPDHLGDHLATGRKLDEAIKVFGKEKLLPVVQGHEFRYVLECAGYIKKLGFTEVAVPYDIMSSRCDSLEEMADRREEVVSRLLLLYGFEVHLLGMTTLEELESYRGIGGIRSIDTGSPVLHGLQSIRFGRDKLLPKAVPTLQQMKLLGNPDLESVYYNICYLRGILSGDNEFSSRA